MPGRRKTRTDVAGERTSVGWHRHVRDRDGRYTGALAQTRNCTFQMNAKVTGDAGLGSLNVNGNALTFSDPNGWALGANQGHQSSPRWPVAAKFEQRTTAVVSLKGVALGLEPI
jgi:hypothetical protein